MTRNRIIAALTVTFIVTCIIASAASTERTDDQLTDVDAVSLVRQFNTAEAELFGARNGSHRYMPLAKVLETPSLKSQIKVSVAISDETSGTVKNYSVSLIPSADGKHYMLSLAPMGCGPAFFSNETGVIYPGKAAGCD